VIVENGRAAGVEFVRAGIKHIVRAKREVILSGGTYNSPQLLLLSGIGPAAELQKQGITPVVNLPGVGANLSEHPAVMLEFAARRPETFLNELRFDRVALSVLRWALFGSGPAATQINSANGIVRTDRSLDRPDIQYMCNPVRMDARPWFPGISAAKAHVFSVGVVGLHPRSRGSVSLRSANPADPPRIVMNLLTDPADLATLRRGIREARRIYRTPPQGTLTGAEMTPGEKISSDADLNAFILSTAQLTQHPVGTCSMGRGPNAVVDPQARVYGVEGLRVVDASVMPTVPGGNTNAAVIMLGEKVSAQCCLIASQWTLRPRRRSKSAISDWSSRCSSASCSHWTPHRFRSISVRITGSTIRWLATVPPGSWLSWMRGASGSPMPATICSVCLPMATM
jgi:choline dehydrogenase